MVGDRQGRHVQYPRLIYKGIDRGCAVEKAVLGMDMKVNKTHGSISIEDSGEKPVLANLAKLINSGAGALCADTAEEPHLLPVPPLRRFPPLVINVNNPVKAPSPDEGCDCGVFVLVHCDGFINELRHGAYLGKGL